jgi:hypothetical protein
MLEERQTAMQLTDYEKSILDGDFGDDAQRIM